jgi:hypothetical protein
MQKATVLVAKHQETMTFIRAAMDKLGVSSKIKERVQCLYHFQVDNYDKQAQEYSKFQKKGNGSKISK